MAEQTYLSFGVFTQDFSSEFSELLSFLQAENATYLIVGDFNFHVNIYIVDAKKQKTVLHQFHLIQHVNIPTHRTGNTLGLVISRGDISVKDILRYLSVRSDHCLIYIIITFSWITKAECEAPRLKVCGSWPTTEGHLECFFWLFLFWYGISCTWLYPRYMVPRYSGYHKHYRHRAD